MNVPPSGQPAWLAQTKFHPPRLGEDVLPRPRLLEALHHAVATHPLTLISAPAGYGKTTLLAVYCGEVQKSRHAGDNCSSAPRLPCSLAQVAWLTLDEEDNDPARFLTALVVALQRLNPACGTTVQALLAGLPNPGAQVRQVTGVLINDILETLPDPFVLILDDLHLITESAVFVTLDYLLVHLPSQMHLIIGTRHDPPLALARLRARGQLAELGLTELCFTLEEAASFLNEKRGLGLSSDDLAALHARTEGWPAGLRLLAGSLHRIPTSAGRSAFIQHLGRTERYVFDFLAEEVLNRQEPAVRAFLLETSILSELTPTLCQAVTGRSDAAKVLEEVHRRNLFLVALDDRPWTTDDGGAEAIHRPWSIVHRPSYRYHALFAEFLHQRLMREMPEQVPELHRRAAEAQTDPGRSIRHYLAAEMWEEAAQRIEGVMGGMLQIGMWDTVQGWVRALPAPVREAHPLLLHGLGACALLRDNRPDEAQVLLERALEGYATLDDQRFVGDALAMLASCAMLQGDFERCPALIAQALTYRLVPETRVEVLMARAWMAIFMGDDTQAAADLQEALAIAEKSRTLDVLNVLAFHLNPLFAVLPAGLECLERFCHLAAEQMGEQISPLDVATGRVQTFLHFWRGRLDEAIQTGERALALSQRFGGAFPLEGDLATTLSDVHIARGDYAAAEALFQRVLEQVDQVPMLGNLLRVNALTLLGRMRWLEGRLEEAHQIYTQMCAAARAHETPWTPTLLATMRGRLEIAEKRYLDAEHTLRQAVAMEQRAPYATLLGCARMLLAHLYLAWDHPDEALAELEPLLAECKQQGTPGRILLEGAAGVPALRLAVERCVHATFAARLLDLLGAGAEPRPVYVPETGETLTPREVEVLRLLAQGASNRGIAERLVISQGTVKSHVHHILRKLDANSRTEAAARARELRLI